MQTVTPTQFFEEGRSFTVDIKFDDTTIGVRTWAVRTTLEMGDGKQAIPGFSIFAKGEYLHGGRLQVDIPDLPYDQMWPMVSEIVKEATWRGLKRKKMIASSTSTATPGSRSSKRQ